MDWYGNALSEHQIDSKSVGWKSSKEQYLRFHKLFNVVDDASLNEPSVYSDYGAGYGEMFKFLNERCNVARYDGYEINSSMLKKGEQYLKDERVKFIGSTEMQEEADYTFVSGTFNVRMKNDSHSWENYIKETILHLFEKSRKGLSFNCLTSYVDWKQEDLFYADPKVFFDFCKTKLSKYVILLHDYPLYEWTLCVRKDPKT